jgi:multidrug efflux pump subunit AcrA (membrane-fusion protein)
MIKHNQDGAVNGVLISLIMAVLLLIAALGFGGWAYSSRQDYKDHSDQKAAAAAETAKQAESIAKDKQFAEDSKNPLKTYNGPSAYGSLVVNYPKTWSGYVDDSGTGQAQVDGYFNPGVVPPLSGQTSVFALRVQVLNQQYSQVLQSFAGQQQAGKLKVSAYALPKLPNVVGVRVTGQLNNNKNVDMVVLPLRAQTIQISTEGGQFGNDFNTYILPNFSFSP